MRDTFADTSRRAAGPRLPSTVRLREGLRARMGLDPGAGMRRAPAARAAPPWPLAGVRAAASRTSPPSPATPTRSSGRPARRRSRRSSGRPPASTSSGSSTASPRASTAPRRGSPWATATSRRAAPATTSWPSAAYREFLTLYPSHPKSDYAQFQVGECLLPAEERARPRPDRHPGGARGVPAAARPLPATRPRRGGPRADHGVPPEPGPGGVPGRLLLPADPPGLPRRHRPLRGRPQRLSRTTAASTRCCSAWPSACCLSGPGRRGPAPPRAGCWRSIPKSALRRARRKQLMATRRGRRPRPPPRRPGRPPPSPRHSPPPTPAARP